MIIDVSHNNGTIQWEKVKPHIEKAIIRVGYGDNITSQDDRQFARNLSECKRLNIPYDFYIYSYAKSTVQAKSEAEHCMRLVSDKSKIIYFDSEQAGTESVARQCAEAFRDSIKSAGYQVGLYASESWYNSFLKGITGFDSLWIAKYGPNDGKENTKPNIDCDLWQYTSKGRINGIDGYVDLNKQLKEVATSAPTKTVDEIANEVLSGQWENGDERKRRLEAAGYSYAEVQKAVNAKLNNKKSITEIAKEVIAGKWSNGETRKKKLKAAGYDPNAVQKEVNRLMTMRV